MPNHTGGFLMFRTCMAFQSLRLEYSCTKKKRQEAQSLSLRKQIGRSSTIRPRFLTCLLAVVAIATLCGCRSVLLLALKPSDRIRHESFAKTHQWFTGDQDSVKHQTYVVFSGNWQTNAPYLDEKTGKYMLPPMAEKGLPVRGLAIGLESDGYLLTAAHVLGPTNFVCGDFEGKFDVKPARVVYRKDSPDHADVALLKVAAKLNRCATYGDAPQVGDRSFAVVLYPGRGPRTWFLISRRALSATSGTIPREARSS